MMLLKIAFRNILRNARRSLMTTSAIAVGVASLVLFGEFVGNVITGLQTQTVRRYGHLTLFHTGYFNFGAGNPGAYGIGDYQGVMQLIKNDPVIAPRLRVLTPTVTLFGIAGNFDIDASKTFMGVGVMPSDRDRMRAWDEYRQLDGQSADASGLRDDDETRGVVGVGLARVLGLCESLKLADCPARPKPASGAPPAGSAPAATVLELAGRDREPGAAAPGGGLPRLDLLAATTAGAPNVLSLYVGKAEQQGAKELDDNFVAMHFTLAQKLLYGRGERKALGIVLQLQRTEDMPVVRARLAALVKDHGLDLEIRDFTELWPFYKQVIGMFGAIFSFLAVIMAVIVLFTVVNTMSMSVMERTSEIGTARAMGLRRAGIRRQFVIEGSLLGAIGATIGLVLGALLAFAINHAGMTWTPPNSASPIPLRVLTSGVELLNLAIWLGLVLMSAVAALLPANRAARLPVVDALRHI